MGFAAMTSGSAGFIKRFREMRVGEYRNPHLIHERYRQNAARIGYRNQTKRITDATKAKTLCT